MTKKDLQEKTPGERTLLFKEDFNKLLKKYGYYIYHTGNNEYEIAVVDQTTNRCVNL